MKLAQTKLTTELLLVGGGHAHVQVIKAFAMRPLPGVRITLVSPDPHTPYSGMLPGLIAGHYSFDEAHIDLNALCRFAGVRFIMSEVTGLDLAHNLALFSTRPALHFDYVSIDTGSTPRTADVPGAAEFAIPVKPISQFLARWNALAARAAATAEPLDIAVVGAGAGGVELLLAAQHALVNARTSAGIKAATRFHIFSSGGHILPGNSATLQSILTRLLHKRGVRVHLNQSVTRVEAGILRTANGGRFEADEILWVTAAGAPAWPHAAGLAVNNDGFISVRQTLQSLSHKNVFAAGDVAFMQDNPRPKAGVFAVRQGPVLADNLRRMTLGAPLKTYRPQKDYLKIIATGNKHAVAARGRHTLTGDWVWQWKDRIDRAFMAKFNDLPDMPARPSLIKRLKNAFQVDREKPEDMRCGGCGSKIGSAILLRALSGLQVLKRSDVLTGLESPDDAAVLQTPASMVNVLSVDSFRAMIDDPYVFGQIAATHALGDIYAMGAKPQSAMALVSLPANAETIVESDLTQMMHGANTVLAVAGAALTGGHTAEGTELSLGFSVTGLAKPDAILRKTGLRAGDCLILTKPLGTGALLAADMRHKAKGRHVAAAIASMLHSNARAADIFASYDATACTDITGFGLAGHMMEMLQGSRLQARINNAALPLLEGVCEAMCAGIHSTLQSENARIAARMDSGPHTLAEIAIMFDPQTCGGLLAGIAADKADACLHALREAGYAQASLIGGMDVGSDAQKQIQLT